MRITNQGRTLNVSGIKQLAAANRNDFASALSAALPKGVTQIEIDLSQTGFVDCGGVGALVALRNTARGLSEQVTIRLLNPSSAAQRIFKLTRMAELFPIECG